MRILCASNSKSMLLRILHLCPEKIANCIAIASVFHLRENCKALCQSNLSGDTFSIEAPLPN